MSTVNKYESLLTNLDDSVEYWAEGAVLDFTGDLARLMDANDISRAELAKRVGTSPAYITKIFSGQANFTIETMTKFALALDHALRIHVAPKAARTRWIDTFINDAFRVEQSIDNVVEFTVGDTKDVARPVAQFEWIEGSRENG